MKHESITSDAFFENFYASANGDINALSPASLKIFKKIPRMFARYCNLINL